MNDRNGWDDRNDSDRWHRQSGEGSQPSHHDDHRGQDRWRSEEDDWSSRNSRTDYDRERRSGGSGTFGYGESRVGGYGGSSSSHGYGSQSRADYGARQSYANQANQGQSDWGQNDRGRRYSSSAYGYGTGQQGDTTPPQPYFTGQQQGWEVPPAYGAPGTFGASYGGGTGGYSGGAGGSAGYGEDYREHGYGSRRHERGFLQRAGDEVASWFGDEDAARRREQDHRGRGPSDYTRSDERIREDANDRLTEDWRVDASRLSVSVEKGEVTLSGTVNRREDKRRAEDIVEDVSGVKHVQNNLRVEAAAWSGATTTATGLGSSLSNATSTAGSASDTKKTNTAPT